MDAGSGDNEKVGLEVNEEVSRNIFEKCFEVFVVNVLLCFTEISK